MAEVNPMTIREATSEDFEKIWPIFQAVVQAGQTYPYPRDTDYESGEALWMQMPRKTYVCEEAGKVLGTYYLKHNPSGQAGHVCNCGYMVSADALGRGVATAMCEHSQVMAIELGYKAMQYNLVISTNERAVRLWQKLGFEIVGRLPKAFDHPTLGYVDALVMYKWLAGDGPA